jgi:hypothetical protein
MTGTYLGGGGHTMFLRDLSICFGDVGGSGSGTDIL